MIVEAAHPAWVRHQPRGARLMRDALVLTRTAIEVPDVPADAVEPAGGLHTAWSRRNGSWVPEHAAAPIALHRHGDTLYQRLSHETPGKPARPVTPGQLAAFLAGGGDVEVAATLRDALLWLPFADPLPPKLTPVDGGPNHRGTVVDLDASRGIEVDGRAAASAAIAEAARRDLLVAGGHAYRRFEPFARCISYGSGKGTVTLHPHREADFRNALPFAPERHREAAGFEGIADAAALPPATAAVLDLLPTDTGDADVALSMAHLSCEAARWLLTAERARSARGLGIEGTRRLAALVAPLHMMARMGTLPETALPRAVGVLAQALDHVSETEDALGHHRVAAKRGLSYLDRVAMPRLGSRQVVADEDLDAIGGLVP